jgi:hypothetical protein
MYFWRFHYECIKTHWEGAELGYHDTDSGAYHLPTRNFVKEALAWNELPKAKIIGPFDLSTHKINIPENGQLGTIKDEVGKEGVDEVVALSSKTWAYRCKEESVRKGKGIPKGVLESLTFDDYREELFNPERKKVDFKALGVHKFQSIKKDCEKKSISFENDKAFIWRVGDEFHSRPLGHRDNPKTLKALKEMSGEQP